MLTFRKNEYIYPLGYEGLRHVSTIRCNTTQTSKDQLWQKIADIQCVDMILGIASFSYFIPVGTYTTNEFEP